MIVTTKIKFQNKIDIEKELRLFNSIVRSAYNQASSGAKQKEIRHHCKELFPEATSWLLQNAVMDGISWYKKYKSKQKNDTKNKPLIFGGRHNFMKRLAGKITKDEWRKLRQHPIIIQGEALAKGNRFMELHIEEDNTILIKFSRTNKIKLQLPKLRKPLKNKMIRLQHLMNERILPVTFRLSNDFIWLSYDEAILTESYMREKDLREDVVCGIDMNPNHIGISICKINTGNYSIKKILHKETIDLTELNSKEAIKYDKDSVEEYNKKKTKLTNKRKHEIVEVCKHIEKICRRFKCKVVAVEDLSNLEVKNHKKGRRFNKMVNNTWLRTLFQTNLQKRVENYGGKFEKVNPMFSSTIGNLCFDSVDEVNAATEIARRGSHKWVKGVSIYPPISCIKDQWKEYFMQCEDWRDVHKEIKNSKLKYRVPLDDVALKQCHYLVSRKSYTKLYILA